MEFVLIRHTRCNIAAGTCYGRLDVPLADSAPEDIERTLAQTPPVDSVVCSPAQRCHRLALALGRRDGCEVRVEPALQELDFGAWEGLKWDEIPRVLSDEWAADPWRRAPPEGETECDCAGGRRDAADDDRQSHRRNQPRGTAAHLALPSDTTAAQRALVMEHRVR